MRALIMGGCEDVTRVVTASLMAIFLFWLACTLSGCATWAHPAKGPKAFEADAYECQRDGAAIQDPWRAQSLYRRCMNLKGWREQ